MKNVPIMLTTLLLWLSAPCNASSDPEELTKLLHEFMKGASTNNFDAHQQFWAEDLIYTSSSGERFGKAEIMEGLSPSDQSDPDDASATSYSAGEIQIQLYGEMAVVAFRLVGESVTNADSAGQAESVQYYLNTGTFIKREGAWQAVAWQATKVPGDDAE